MIFPRSSLFMGEKIPLGYGIAWQMVDRNAYVILPIPINLIAGLARRIWRAMLFGIGRPAMDKAIHQAYERGLEEGRKKARKEHLVERYGPAAAAIAFRLEKEREESLRYQESRRA